jgi:ferredoxin
MPYVVTENCIRCKYTDCVEVCPVDCFFEGENMLVIHPDLCIDCGLCEPACPAEAIHDAGRPDAEVWMERNRDLAQAWPNITRKIEPLAEADRMRTEPNKFSRYFSDKPAPR